MTRLPRLGTLRLLAAAPLLIFSLSGFSGYFATQAIDNVNHNYLFSKVACSTHPYPGGDTCKGLGQGLLGGFWFTGIFKTDGSPASLMSCHSTTCEGGFITSSGTGTWGANHVNFTVCGEDRDPIHQDSIAVAISTPIAASLDSISPFVDNVCQTHSGSAESGSIHTIQGGGFFTFNCRDCFEFTRTFR